MITSVQGQLAEAGPLHAIIELQGLGYEVHIPVTTAEKLPAVGATVKLHTHVIYREDAQTLYGFSSTAERDFFRLMIENVTGVGPKLALTIMSKLSLPLLQGAIAAGDLGTLAKCPGIGKKTAERLVIELRGKVGGAHGAGGIGGTTELTPGGAGAPGSPSAAGNAHFTPGPAQRVSDAVKALSSLGYRPVDADEAVRKAGLLLGPTATTEQLIKKALNG